MPTISATVITYNEQKDLDACLQSILWCDEIFVVDSFSTDKTVEIAKKYTPNIHQRKWYGPADQKNHAATLANCEWILQIDADEIIPQELQKEMIQIVNKDIDIDAYYCARKNYWLGYWIKHGGWYPDLAIRLYKKGAGIWIGASHERFVISGKSGVLTNPLIHNNIRSVHEHVQKQIYSSVLEMKDVVDNDLELFYIFPFNSAWKFLVEFIKRPKTWVTIRILYKEIFKNRLEIAWLIPLYPIVRFIYMYFFRFGFLDGIPGFWVATLSSTNEAFRHAKIWEYLQLKKHSKDISHYIDKNIISRSTQSAWPKDE